MSRQILGEPWDGYLRDLMVDPFEVQRAIEAAPRESTSGDAEILVCDCLVAARRPEDPETAALRRLRIVYQPDSEGFRVLKIAEVGRPRRAG